MPLIQRKDQDSLLPLTGQNSSLQMFLPHTAAALHTEQRYHEMWDNV
jgi:hypothetical protein